MLHSIEAKNIVELAKAEQMQWDIIIVGAGMGGGCAAWTLSKAGLKVLLLDKGAANFSGTGESVAIEPENEEQQYINGKWPTQIGTKIDGSSHAMWAPLGCGMGGSTLLYAAALQRFRVSDFEDKETPLGDKVGWPFSYQEIEPYYQMAEKQFSVCGTEDPLDPDATSKLAPPPPMCEQDQNLFFALKDSGYHPYRLHVGVKYKKDCGECGGHLCMRDCKRDTYNSCIVPALETNNLSVAEYAEAEKLYLDGKRVIGIEAKQNGKVYKLKADTVVLALGAYFTPLLLKRSRNTEWPEGLANTSGQLGKNLMFHASDFLGLWPSKKCSREGANKTIAMRDLYEVDGKKVGEFQSTGLAADFGLIMFSLRLLFDQSIFSKLPILRHFLRIPAYIASKLYGEATVFTTIIEDYPYPENQVFEDPEAPSNMRFEYTIHDELKERVALMRNHMKDNLKKLRMIPMNLKVQLNYGHPCGTARMGNDPSKSVLDGEGKIHDLDNVYVVDASAMPSSGGTNPSLTIAANALRISERLAERLNNQK